MNLFVHICVLTELKKLVLQFWGHNQLLELLGSQNDCVSSYFAKVF